MATVLRDVAVAGCARPRSMPLAMLTMKKEFHGKNSKQTAVINITRQRML